MRRREFVTTTAGLTAGALAGCLDTALDSGPENSPWDSETLVVGRDGLVGRVDEPDEMIHKALDFWERQSDEYLDYPVSFEYDSDAESPEIVVKYVDEVAECGQSHGDALVGCAPVVEREANEPVTARIEVGHPPDEILRTIKHELGHVLGLKHDDEPAEVMANDPAKYIEDYEVKQTIMDEYGSATRMYNSAMGEYNRAIGDWEDERYQQVSSAMGSASTAFRTAADDYASAAESAADIDEQEVAEALRRGERKANLYADAAEHLGEAADAHAAGDRDRARQAFNDYQAAIDEANGIEMPNGNHLVEVLGLD